MNTRLSLLQVDLPGILCLMDGSRHLFRLDNMYEMRLRHNMRLESDQSRRTIFENNHHDFVAASGGRVTHVRARSSVQTRQRELRSSYLM
jgi:hypothetical protein